ncbi:acid phosphatase AphA [Treponema phagedenis]|uniref:Class B acid phosphatase n=2 Tax=Treponema phagedenis TaxID=162 RepID=A0A0B7GUH3_TREPH|nr:acid phosphatase AphA [Treponema phagedenis]NVP22769.1 acid phosphatase AphA [Treponema phagedenis]QKS92513.1 acid phosphatase AphA [Treponema phagedenis]QLC57675.1 acid phosphatase AphA [Treponema phagedenis]CEM62138.1 Class B acid phosphatase [Treponema phagedenis]
MKNYQKTKKLFILSCIIAFIFALPAVFSAGPKVPYTHDGFYSTDKIQKAVHFVSVEDIEKSLEGMKPINVSFDIDDTLLHSSGYFRYGQDYFQIPNDPRGKISYLFNQKFWDYVAEMGDEHSIPKQSAKDLIDMHLKRGDKIFFITGRTKHSAAKNYTSNKLSKTLKRFFDLPEEIFVEYTAATPVKGFNYDKSYYIKKHKVSIHYGDSDDDILAAREVGIRAIRVQRAYNSTNSQKLNGGYGEEVLINSAW